MESWGWYGSYITQLSNSYAGAVRASICWDFVTSINTKDKNKTVINKQVDKTGMGAGHSIYCLIDSSTKCRPCTADLEKVMENCEQQGQSPSNDDNSFMETSVWKSDLGGCVIGHYGGPIRN